MKKTFKKFLTVFCASIGLLSLTAACFTSFRSHVAAAETQAAITSSPIIKTSILGDVDVSSLKMKEGAAVRLKDLNNPNDPTDGTTPASRNGLRFTALFNKKIYQKLEELDEYSKDISVGYGMLIVPYDYIEKYGSVTVENIFGENPKYYISGKTKAQDGLTKLSGWYHMSLPEEDGDTREKEIYCSIINIAQSQLTRQWIGVAYIEYVENGVAQYYMTEVEKENARSMVYVAQRAIQDTSDKAPTDDQKVWLEKYYTTLTSDSVSIPTKEYTYTINHILVDPLGNEQIVSSETKEAQALYNYDETNGYIENTVSSNAEQQHDGYTYNEKTSITSDIVYANHMTALNYYYDQNHCDIQFVGEKCTMKISGKEGEHLSYVVLDGTPSFAFSIVPDVGYSSGTVTVKVNGASVTPVDGLYTVSLSNKNNGDVITIEATVKAGTVSDQVFESENYESKGEQSQSGLGVIAGWLGFGGLKVNEDDGTITSTGGSLELSGEFIKNALNEGYTHMVCDLSVSGGIGTITKVEMVHGKDASKYQKVGTEKTRTDRIDLTEFNNGDGTCASLMFRAYRKAFIGNNEQISSSATVQLSNIRMYKSQATADWTKYQKSTQNGEEVNTEITNAYAAYENGNLVIETMLENTFFERSNSTLAYDLSVGVSMSFAFKYINAGNNSKAFFYHFTNTTDVEHKELSACHIDQNGFAHMCIMPETVKAAAEAVKAGEDVKFHFGLLKPASAMLILANSGASVHGEDPILADTWGYPYGHGIYNEFLQVKDAATAKKGVEFNINMYDNHTIHLEVSANFDFTGFWYGNNYWTGYKAGMHQFTDIDSFEVDGQTTYWTEIIYTHAYTDKGFNIHWREDVEGADGSARVGTMELHYTLTKDATTKYYTFVPDRHTAGIETSEEIHDGIKVETITGVEGTTFTMPVLDNVNEKTITLTVSADWNFKTLQYGAGTALTNFAPSQDGEKYKQTVSVTAVFTNGFHICYPGEAFPEGVVKATIYVSVYVDNFEASSSNNVTIEETEVLQADGWTKYNATNVQKDTVFNFPSMPNSENISVYVTTNIPLNAKDGVLSYGTPDAQMIPLLKSYVSTNTSNNEVVSYYTFFSYCNPDYEGFQIALNASNIDFPADAWIQIQYCFTDFKIKNTENVQYTGIREEEITEDGIVKQKATLYSETSHSRFWLNTAGFVEIRGTITSSEDLAKNVLYYGHGWDTTGVLAVDPTQTVKNADGSWTYSFVYNGNLQNGFCIYYANNGNEDFTGTVYVTYELFTIQDVLHRAEKWDVEPGGTLPTLKANGHVEYTSAMKADGTGYELYIDKSVFEIAYKNGYAFIGVTFASDNTLTAHILNGQGATVEMLQAGTTEYTLFSVRIEDMYSVDENGNMTFEDMVLRFDYLEPEQPSQDTSVTVTLESVAFIHPQN